MQLAEATGLALKTPWLSQQDRRSKELICAHLRLVSLPKNRTLFDMDEPASELCCLVSGAATIAVPHPVLGIVNGHVILPGRWFGEPAALGRRSRMISVITRRPCHLVALSKASVAEMIRIDPQLSWTFFNLMASNVEEYMLHAVDLMITNPQRRFYSRLLTLAGRVQNYLPPGPVSIPLSQEELGIISNMSRSSVYHILNGLVEKGLCKLGYREVIILDTVRLAELVDNDRD